VFLIDAFFRTAGLPADDASSRQRIVSNFAWGVPAFVLIKVSGAGLISPAKIPDPVRYALGVGVFQSYRWAQAWFLLDEGAASGFCRLRSPTSTPRG